MAENGEEKTETVPVTSTPQETCNGSCNPDKSECIPVDGNNCVRLAYRLTPAPTHAEEEQGAVPGELARQLGAEWAGTLLLVMVVVGSGIMAENMSEDVGIQLTINAVATICGLYGLIVIFGPVSGAHFNPMVTYVDVLYGDKTPVTWAMYSVCQIIGGICGAILADIQFDYPIEISSKDRWGPDLWISEIIATATLILVIHGSVRTGKVDCVPQVVALWVGGGYFFTQSTIFANPAVTIGRMFTESFAGIEPPSAGMYIIFQVIGATIGFCLSNFFYPTLPKKQEDLFQHAAVVSMKDVIKKVP